MKEGKKTTKFNFTIESIKIAQGLLFTGSKWCNIWTDENIMERSVITNWDKTFQYLKKKKKKNANMKINKYHCAQWNLRKLQAEFERN